MLDYKYGNCMMVWSVENQVWTVWYCGKLVFSCPGMKGCQDWIRTQRVAGLLPIDAYKEFSNAKR